MKQAIQNKASALRTKIGVKALMLSPVIMPVVAFAQEADGPDSAPIVAKIVAGGLVCAAIGTAWLVVNVGIKIFKLAGRAM